MALFQGYTPLRMFRLADNFFLSLNMSAVPRDFWRKSIFERPNNRDLVCHASAWDFCDGEDFRYEEYMRCSIYSMQL